MAALAERRIIPHDELKSRQERKEGEAEPRPEHLRLLEALLFAASAPLDEKTLVSLGDVQPGQRLFVSYRFDRNGRPEAVVRTGVAGVVGTTTTTTRTAAAPAPAARSQTALGGAVEVVAADPLTRRLKVRTATGERTLIVDDMALVDLQALKAGDTALLTLEGERVLVITRQR